MGIAATFINRPRPFVQIFNLPLTVGSTWSLKKIGTGVSEKTFKGVDDERTEDGQQVTTIVHPEPSAQVSSNIHRKSHNREKTAPKEGEIGE